MTIFDVPLEELRRRTSIKWTRFEPDVIPMFVAEMDVRTPRPIVEALQHAMDEGDFGYPEEPLYQESYVDFAKWRWGWETEANNFITSGDVMQGMRYALEASSERGDKVVFNPPIYPPFRQITDATKRTPVEVPLIDDRLDLEGLERAFADGAKVFLLCSPHNPTGTIHTRDELTTVAELAKQHGVTVISDEIHSPFAGEEFTPFLSLPNLGKAFLSTSAAKAFNLAGLKAGLLAASEESQETLAELPSYVHEATSHLGVIGHSAGLTHCRDWLLELQAEVAANKQFFAELIKERIPELTYEPSQGTYLAWLDCSPLGLENPAEFFHEQARVRFNFGTDFAPESQQFARVNLATSRDIIDEAVKRMRDALIARG